MKKLILLLILVCGTAQAEQWFEAQNNSGGKILLLTTKCVDSDGRMVISNSPSGEAKLGCWYYFAEMIHVIWKDGVVRNSTYDPNAFVVKGEK